MPESLSIAAFVFGAVLLLIAFVGGNFKIFGAELSRTAGPVIRVISGVLGLVFVLVAFADTSTPDPDPIDDRTKRAEDVRPRPDDATPDTVARVISTGGDQREAVEGIAVPGVEAFMDAMRTGSIASRGLFQDDALLALGQLASAVAANGNGFDMVARDIDVADVHFTDAANATATVNYVTEGRVSVLGECYDAPPASQTTAFIMRMERGRWRIHNIELVRVRADDNLRPCGDMSSPAAD